MTELKREGTFHGQDYYIRVKAGVDTLRIELENKYDALWWSNQFSSSYIEELTQKTGQPLKFSQFLEVIKSGIDKKNENSNFDVLTFQDLQEMRSTKMGKPQDLSSGGQVSLSNSDSGNISSSGSISMKKKEKRYVIITAQGLNNEKIHYPLSLNSEDIEDVNLLKAQMKRIKQEVEELRMSSTIRTISEYSRNEEIQKSTGGSFHTPNDPLVETLKSENELLKTKIKRIEENVSLNRGVLEINVLAKSKANLELELETTKSKGKQQIEELKRKIDEREQEVIQSKLNMLELQKEAVIKTQQLFFKEGDEQSKQFKERIINMTQETAEEMKRQLKVLQLQNQEMLRSQTETDFFKIMDDKQRMRIKQLEVEVDSAIKRVASSSIRSDRIFSPYSRNSNTNSPSMKNSRNITPKSNNSYGNNNNKRATSLPSKSYSPLPRNQPLNTNKFQPLQNFNNKVSSPISNTNNSNNRGNFALNGVKSQINSYNQYIQSKKNLYGKQNPSNTSNTRNSPANRSPLNKQQPYSNLVNNRASPVLRNNSNNSNSQLNKQYAQRTSPVGRVSPSTRNSQPQLSKNNASPGTRVNNYLQQQDKNLFKRIDNASNSNNNNKGPFHQNNNINNNNRNNNQYSDLHLEPTHTMNSRDLDQGISKLQNLLKMAKN